VKNCTIPGKPLSVEKKVLDVAQSLKIRDHPSVKIRLSKQQHDDKSNVCAENFKMN